MEKIKIEIKNKWTGNVLFEHEKESNTIKETLKEAIKRGANLYGADLYGANLYGANLEGADLRVADLYGANLYGADLYGANLRGANLRGANLRGADLYGANLRGANLYGANLRGANLYGANLCEADLRGAILFLSDNKISNSTIETIINNLKEDCKLKSISCYINKNVLSPYYLVQWKNALVIDEYEFENEKETQEIIDDEINKEEKKIPEKLEDISEIKCVGCEIEINIAGNKTLFDTDAPMVTEHCIYKINQLIKNQKKIINYLKSKGGE